MSFVLINQLILFSDNEITNILLTQTDALVTTRCSCDRLLNTHLVCKRAKIFLPVTPKLLL